MAEILIAGAVFAVIGAIAAIIGLVLVIGLFARKMREARKIGDNAWYWNMVAEPLVGTAVGYVLGYKLAPAVYGLHHGGAYVAAILCGLYGFWIAPFHAPYLATVKREGWRRAPAEMQWALSYASFGLLAFAWTLVPILVHMNYVRWD